VQSNLENPAPYRSTKMNGADKGFIYSKTNVPPTEFNTEIQKDKNFGGVPGGQPVDSGFQNQGKSRRSIPENWHDSKNLFTTHWT
jgi:hypothetical protein